MLKLQLAEYRDETDRIRVLYFHALGNDKLPGYTPGAHLDFELGALGSRSYSLIDWQPLPASPITYTVAVQREDDGDGGSSAMHQLQVGQTIQVTPPKNDFELLDSSAPVLLLAGGIGVTPLISMATRLREKSATFAFHYAARSARAMGFKEAIGGHFGEHAQLYFDDTAPLDLSKLLAAQPASTEIYICGPAGMIEAARAASIAAGLPTQNIHVELFSTPASNEDDSAFEVEIQETGEVFNIPADKTIIEVLEEAGKDIVFDCQRGDCGICQTDVISGVPDHRDVVLSDAEKASGTVMQICVSRAKSRRLVLDL